MTDSENTISSNPTIVTAEAGTTFIGSSIVTIVSPSSNVAQGVTVGERNTHPASVTIARQTAEWITDERAEPSPQAAEQ